MPRTCASTSLMPSPGLRCWQRHASRAKVELLRRHFAAAFSPQRKVPLEGHSRKGRARTEAQVQVLERALRSQSWRRS
eukprot:scaffold1042_cov401-Prasinococcus_capsulatus_cf.AAC.8